MIHFSQNWRRHIAVVLLPSVLLLTGCNLNPFASNTATPPPPPVGVYKSIDRGDTWAAKNVVLNTNNPPGLLSLGATNVVTLILDPTDPSALYLGSDTQGMYYTYNEAESWYSSRPIRSQAITSIAIPSQPDLRCTIYIATGGRIYKSADCGRHWSEVYQDARTTLRVLSLAVHRSNPAIVYAGLSTGDLLRSADSGKSWTTIGRVNDEIRRIIPHTLNDNVLYVVLAKLGVQKTVDAGVTWSDTSAGLKNYAGAFTIRDVAMDPSRPETLILATDYGLIQTTDGGGTWSPIQLLTPAGKVKIYSVAMNPQKTAELYYTTDTTLYRSSDAGQTWETKALPAPGTITTLLVDPLKTNTLYLGVNRPAQKSSSSPFGF